MLSGNNFARLQLQNLTYINSFPPFIDLHQYYYGADRATLQY
jgi:hypothetical protein